MRTTEPGGRTAVRDVAESLRRLPGTDPVRIRGAVLSALAVASGSDWTLFTDAVEFNGKIVAATVQCHGAPDDRAVEALLLRESERCFEVVFDTRRPPPEVLVNFLGTVATFGRPWRESLIYRRIWRPLGIEEAGALLVYDGPAFVGSVNAIWTRPKDFRPEESRRLRPLVAPIRTALIAADSLARGGTPESAYLIVDERGRVDCSSGEVSHWLDQPSFAKSVSRCVRVLANGGSPRKSELLGISEAQIVEISTQKRKRQFLVCLRPVAHPRREAAAVLTALQLEVATFAAAGATTSEIAASTGRSVETVNEHLEVVYSKLRVSTRVELARALERPRVGSAALPISAR